MYVEERISFILNKLNEDNSVNVSELSDLLGVSEVTIRKDLDMLENKKLLIRTHGGAIKIKHHVIEASFEDKKIHNLEIKKQIAKKSEKFLEDNLNIFLDAGTTVQGLIPYLSNLSNIKVATYDLEIAYKLSNYKNISLYLLGGILDNNTKTFLGIDEYEIMKNMYADICFMGTDALDNKNVYSTSNIKSKIKRRMIENSNISILLCDSSKYGNQSSYSYGRLKDFNFIVTDKSNKNLNRLAEDELSNLVFI